MPDPNSPVLCKIDFVELFKWLDVRDTFLGENNKEQDITAALALARDCRHPDAEWLSSIFEGKDVLTKGDVREVFLLYQDDACALCFAWYQTDNCEDDLTLLRRCSEMGNAFGCSTLCWQFVWGENEDEDEVFRFAQLASNQHERDGFYLLGRCFRDGIGCEQDLTFAKENFLIAAELGDVNAAWLYGNMLNESDLARWLWLGKAALRGSPDSFLRSFSEQVEQFFSGSGNATVVFLIGRALKGNIYMEKKEIFGKKYDFASLIGLTDQAVSFYDSQIKSAHLAIDNGQLLQHDCI